MRKSLIKVLMIFLLINPSYALAYDVIRYHVTQKMSVEKQSYYLDLLKLVLEESRQTYGDYELMPITITMTQERRSKMLENNEVVDVVWRMTSKDLESKLEAIYFPLLKGIMGARIFLIKKGDESNFSAETTLENLKNLYLGQGSDWPDTKILEYNQFQVVKADTSHLLHMLEKERFDYYPRALHEPWLEMIGHDSLTVDKNLMLYYPAPIYFFVNKSNTKLYQRIHDGLYHALETGRFEKFFLEHPISSDVLNKTHVEERKIFQLENPLLSEKTRQLYKEKQLWIKLPIPRIPALQKQSYN